LIFIITFKQPHHSLSKIPLDHDSLSLYVSGYNLLNYHW
jgi:hypothetical protein